MFLVKGFLLSYDFKIYNSQIRRGCILPAKCCFLQQKGEQFQFLSSLDESGAQGKHIAEKNKA